MAEPSFQEITDMSTAVGLTVPAAAYAAHVQALGGDVFYRLDGTDPTAAIGTKLPEDADMLISGRDAMENANFFAATSTPDLAVHYHLRSV